MNILRFLREQSKDYNCTSCGANHSRSEIRLLGKLEAAWVVRVTCSKCTAQVKLLVVVDAASAPVKRDHPSEVRRRAPLTADDVLDAHELLASYDGGLDPLIEINDSEKAARGAAS